MDKNMIIKSECKYIIEKAEAIIKEQKKWKDNKNFPIGDIGYVNEKITHIENSIKIIKEQYKGEKEKKPESNNKEKQPNQADKLVKQMEGMI